MESLYTRDDNFLGYLVGMTEPKCCYDVPQAVVLDTSMPVLDLLALHLGPHRLASPN